MAATLEIWDSRGRDYKTLTGEVVLAGSAADADLVLDDKTVSAIHARFERAGNTWLVQDWGSKNGTLWNGRRLIGARRLRHGDEIVVGRTKLVFLDKASHRKPGTLPLDEIPSLTPTERSVLIE